MADQQHPTSPTPAPQPTDSSRHSWVRSRARLLFLGGIPFVFAVVLLIALISDKSPESEMIVGNKLHTIQLDVLNSTSESKLAQRVTDYLRSRGYDVVEIGNYAGDLEKTLVIDRTGNKEAAVRVAQSLGIPELQVIQKIDKTLYLDVSVYIGKDFRSLNPFH